VELLVVIAIIGVLIGLLLPAVQKIREAANRTVCKNNMHQLGLALHMYHDSFREFPRGADKNYWAWSVYILPFVEQDSLYQQLDPAHNTLRATLSNPVKLELMQTPLKVFICPSDSNETLNDNRPFNFDPNTYIIPKSNYPGNGGNLGGSGIFSTGKPIGLKDVTDGTSSTFLVGERASTQGRFAALWGGWDVTGPPAESLWGYTLYRMMDGYSGTSVPFPDQAFSSLHTGGCNFLLCDGSVHFVSQAIDWQPFGQPLGTYNKLGDRKDGQAVGDF
jgi:prepilin-type processing-associated H-X9-DG protein